jgi:hypothetical protein
MTPTGSRKTKVDAVTAGPEKINDDLLPLAKPISALKSNPANVRAHGERSIEAIVASLDRSGQQKPVVADLDGTVLAGNGTLEAAIRLGWRRLAVVFFDGKSTNEARAFALADNRTAELSKWDHEGLSKLLIEMQSERFNLEGLGWDTKELDMLLQASWETPEKKEGGLAGDDVKRSITMTHEQYEVVVSAIVRLRTREGDSEITDGRALELICADFLAGGTAA